MQPQRHSPISTKRKKGIVESVSSSPVHSRKVVGLGSAAETSHHATDDVGFPNSTNFIYHPWDLFKSTVFPNSFLFNSPLHVAPRQCRINNSSKCSNCYGPRAFGGSAVLCAEAVFYHARVDIRIYLSSRDKPPRKVAYVLHMLYRNFIRWKQVKFFVLSGISLLRESPFHTVNCLKSFDFTLFLSTH